MDWKDFEDWLRCDYRGGLQEQTVRTFRYTMENMRDDGLDWGRFFRSPQEARSEARSAMSRRKQRASMERKPEIWSGHVERRWKRILNVAAKYAGTMNEAFYQVRQQDRDGVPYTGVLRWDLNQAPKCNPRRLTPEQVDRLHDYKCRTKWENLRRRCLIFLSMMIGARPCQLAKLNAEHFHLEGKFPFVHVPAAKGGDPSDTPIPRIATHPNMPLMAYIRARPDATDGSTAFFLGRKHGLKGSYERMSEAAIMRDAYAVRKAVGFPFSLYDLRRYRNFYEMRIGLDVQLSADSNGQTSTKHTLGYRGRRTVEEKADALARRGAPGFSKIQPINAPYMRLKKDEGVAVEE